MQNYNKYWSTPMIDQNVKVFNRNSYERQETADNVEKGSHINIAAGMVVVVAAVVVGPFIVASSPIWSPYVGQGLARTMSFAKQPFVAATGKYGATAKVIAWHQIANFTSDTYTQTLNVTLNGQSWNYGSSAGNLYFANPVKSALPGLLYGSATNPMAVKTNLYNFMWDVGGNYLGNGIGNTKLRLGSKIGLGGFGLPIIWNSAEYILAPSIK
jgi:hypothetical protein